MSEHLSHSPEQGILYADLSPEVRSYVDNLRTQIYDLLKKYGITATNLQEAADALAVQARENTKQLLPDIHRFNALLTALNTIRETGDFPEEVARTKEGITDQTIDYIGPLFPGIFSDYPHLENVYTKFPEGKIERRTVEIGGRTLEELEHDLIAGGYKISDLAKDIFAQVTISTERQDVNLVRLTVSDLGFTEATRYDEIIRRAEEFGLDLCPAELGPNLCLAIFDQPMNGVVTVAMEPLADRNGRPSVFYVARREGGRWLNACYGSPGHQWAPESAFVFVPSKH